MFEFLKRNKLHKYRELSKTLSLFSFDGYECYAYCAKVCDGDTVWLVFKYFNKVIKLRCRCAGYNSAEKNTDQGVIASTYLSELIEDNIVRVKFGKNDKYGRPLVNIYFGTIEVNRHMVEKGYGKIYFGVGPKE